jgi:hypothetical protein
VGIREINKQALVSQYSVPGHACLCLQLSQKVNKLRGPLTHFLKAFRVQKILGPPISCSLTTTTITPWTASNNKLIAALAWSGVGWGGGTQIGHDP